jgi:hypothetical protein
MRRKIGRSVFKGKTIFFPPKHEKYAEIVSLRTPSEARKSARILLSEFNKATTRSKKRLIKKVTILAANRAYATLQRERLSPKERREFTAIMKIYGNAAGKMIL